MPSASMYASPYTWKEPPPKIKYPSFFYGLRDCTLRYVLDSKFLALSLLLLLLSWFVVILMAIMPFWFELVLSSTDATFGGMQKQLGAVINTGIFFMREDHFDNLAFLDKYNNRDVLPKVLVFAQVCSVLGNCIITGCVAAAFILVVRRFGSATANMMLAAAASIGAIFEVLACVFSGILLGMSSCSPDDSPDSCKYEDNAVWRMIPMYTQHYRVEPHLTPMVKASWAFYISWIGAGLCVAAAVMLWIEALSSSSSLTTIRYQQLKQVNDPYENDIDPSDGKKYVYAAPEHYGPGVYGMQPVMAPQGMYAQGYGVSYQPANVGYVPPAQVGYGYVPPAQPTVSYGQPQNLSFQPGMSSYTGSESEYSVQEHKPHKPPTREINL